MLDNIILIAIDPVKQIRTCFSIKAAFQVGRSVPIKLSSSPTWEGTEVDIVDVNVNPDKLFQKS